MTRDWMKKIVDGGAENCEDNMAEAVTEYTDAITNAIGSFKRTEMPIICAALKHVLSTVMDDMDPMELGIAAVFNSAFDIEGKVVRHEQNR